MSIQFSGLASGIDTESMIKELMKAERMKVENVEKEKTKLEWKQEIWQDMNNKLYDFYTNQLFDLKSKGTFLQKNVTSSNESVATVTGDVDAVEGSHSLNVTQVAKGSFLTSDALGDDLNGEEIALSTTAEELIDFGGLTEVNLAVKTESTETESEIAITKNDTLGDIIKKLKEADNDLNINYDSNFNRMFLSTKSTGNDKQIELTGNEDLINALGFGTNNIGSNGEDANIEYNGTVLTSSSNEVSVNGLNIKLNSEGETNITIAQDVESTYESIKDFVLKYNELIMDINGKIDADSAREYQPLTNEEKEAMSENDIKLWEEKIKNSLLRRDNILSGLVTSMRNTLTGSSGVDTSDMDYQYLSQLGIVTGDYAEKGILHIEGDKDDSLYSANNNKLKEAIKDNPEGVAEFFNAIGDKLDKTFSNQMKSTKLSSALTFYNDKHMNEKVLDYEEKILDLEERMIVVEDRYYRQFTAMEKAMQQANTTSDWLTQQLGGMQ
ncbi:MAG: flagellar filament capping protein FliD [Eubacteriales bacterium]